MNDRKHLILVAVVILVGVTLSAQSIPNLTITRMDRSETTLQEYLHTGPVMINFWSLTCAPCKREMKHLDRFARQYRPQGFDVISINIDSPKSLGRVRGFVQSRDYAFPVFLDPRQEIFRKLGGRVMPYSVFVNEDGTIESKHVGYAPGDEKKYQKIITEMISSTSEQ